jgi:hypothetical protein
MGHFGEVGGGPSSGGSSSSSILSSKKAMIMMRMQTKMSMKGRKFPYMYHHHHYQYHSLMFPTPTHPPLPPPPPPPPPDPTVMSGSMVSACQGCDTEKMLKLLENGEGVNGSNMHGETPLMMALLKSQLAPVRLLAEHGADVTRIGLNGWNMLHIAAFGGNPVCVYWVLGNSKIPIDGVDNDGRTPMMLALDKKHEHVANVLVERGCNMFLRTSWVRRALDYDLGPETLQHGREFLQRDKNMRYKTVRPLLLLAHSCAANPLNNNNSSLILRVLGNDDLVKLIATFLKRRSRKIITRDPELEADVPTAVKIRVEATLAAHAAAAKAKKVAAENAAFITSSKRSLSLGWIEKVELEGGIEGEARKSKSPR